MKLALYFFSLAGEGGGAERSLVRLAGEMTRRGHEVLIVSWDAADARSFYALPPAVPWHRLGTGGTFAKLRRSARLLSLLKRERPDLFVGFVMGADRSIYTVNRLLRIPIVAAERNAPDMYRMRLSAPAANAYLHLFTLCRGIQVQFESYRAGYPVPVRNRIAVIPNVVDPAPSLADPGRAAERRTLLCAGRLSRQKGFDVLVDAFANLAPRFPGWDLRIVGEGEERAALEERVRRAGLENRVSMPGTARDMHAVYTRANLFVMPSRWEGFPNALAEAMAHGLPAVGFAGAAGVNELIANGETGVLAEGSEDAGKLAEALSALMRDDGLRRTMGVNAAAAMRRYAADVVFDRWALFLERCAAGPAPDFSDLS